MIHINFISVNILKYILYLFIFINFIQCEKYPDGNYCTTVTITNDDEGKDYRLLVNVEELRLTQIYFPNGGYLNKDHFEFHDEPEVDKSDGFCEFYDDRGRFFQLYLEPEEKCSFGDCNDCSK